MNYIDNNQTAEQLAKTEFSPKIRQQFVNLIYRGYSLVNALQKNSDIYKTDIGKDLLPYILNLGVQYEFMNAAKNELLPYTYSSKLNQKKNCHHIELESKNCIITICQLQKNIKIPRYAIFRQNKALNNGQISLFYNDEEPIDNKKFFVIITHQKLNNEFEKPRFINIGFPNAKCNEWIYNEPLVGFPFSILSSEEKIQEPTIDLKSFKKFIEGDN